MLYFKTIKLFNFTIILITSEQIKNLIERLGALRRYL